MTMTDSDKERWDKIEELLKKENIKLKFKELQITHSRIKL